MSSQRLPSRRVVSLPSKLSFLVLLLIRAVAVQAQDTATITFALDFPGSDPSHYVISIASDGHGSYQGNGRLVFLSATQTDDSDPESERLEFTASSVLVSKTFALAKQAKYFQGKVDSGNKKLAFTGDKTLTYKDGRQEGHATYNYSSVPAVLELTHLFQSLSSTLEFGRRLEYAHRHQKLALDAETKKLEDATKAGSAEDISAIGDILQSIVDDRSVLNMTRARAQRILAQSSGK